MALRKILVGGAAVAALAVVAASMPSAVPGFISPAQADVDVSINLGTFYNDLTPYGDWVSYNNSYVFVPAGADPRWRPYARGRWEYTKRYGWVWLSDDPHGWATHHYGRWGHAAGIGWYWVPDTQWGPAWVDWRRDDDYVAWAPLAPGGNGVSVVVDANPAPVPDFYWAAVAAPNFLAPNLAINIIDDNRRYDVIRRTRPIGRVAYRNNVVVNNFIDIDYVERRTKRKVEVREIREARDRRDAGKRDGNQLAIYNPRVERKGDARPKKAESVEQVARKKRTENPEFATRTEEFQKRRALKRETEETDKTAKEQKDKKAKEAATQPAEDATNAKQKAREEKKQRQQEQEAATKQDEQTSKKKAREEKKRQQDQEATKQDDQSDQSNKKKQREERAAKNADAEKQQKAKQRQEKQQENKKKKQQDQESLAPRQQQNEQAKARKAEARQADAKKAEKPAKREKAENNNKKKKQQNETAQQ